MTVQQSLLQEASDEDLQRLMEADESLPESMRRWPQELAAMLRVIEATLVRRGMDKQAAFAAAADVTTDLAAYRGGRMLYIPQGQRLALALRDAEIWRRFNGRNYQALADEFGMTVVSMYEIIREQRALNTRKIQGQLFEATKGTTE